ncbi:unnamed protein product [Lymnaea stagnalis]|uniref:RING-type E3 ubiquitin transferase n=1 Tax=Lymnaea stagnalis TaxID=6523 RepID=A0AAV2HEV5_LYMST
MNQRCKMLCYISQPRLGPNRQCTVIETDIDPKQIGQVLLDKVLNKLGILEVDYFGLQYKGPKNEDLWLNLRNRVCDHEIHRSHYVYRFSLRVKFFVAPHLVQQESTRELFYTQVKDEMSKGLISLTEPECDKSKLATIVALITQADCGDQTGNEYQRTVYAQILKEICPSYEPDTSILENVHTLHSNLRGMSTGSARYRMLKEVSTLSSYGVEQHKAMNSQGEEVLFRVGPDGIMLTEGRANIVKMLPYTQIRLATHNEKVVRIELINDAGETEKEECFKLISSRAAVALYRCITEMHSFYRCDTICSDVQSQYCRDFRGTFVSIFNENSDLGKRYIFDIQRTRQEAYDYVRRQLYASPEASPAHCGYNVPVFQFDDHELGTLEKTDVTGSNMNLERDVKLLKERIEGLQDALLCCICMDKIVCVVLCPCGHMTCEECSKCIENCPQCRAGVERFQKVFQDFGFHRRKEQQIV